MSISEGDIVQITDDKILDGNPLYSAIGVVVGTINNSFLVFNFISKSYKSAYNLPGEMYICLEQELTRIGKSAVSLDLNSILEPFNEVCKNFESENPEIVEILNELQCEEG